MLGYRAAGRHDVARGEGAEAALPARRRRGRSRAVREQLQGLYRPSWRQGRARGRRDPARRRLYARSTASTSISRAACNSREKAVDPPGDAREDWSILRALSDALGKPLAVRQLRRAARRVVRRPSRRSPGPGLVAFDWAPPKLDGGKIAKGTAIAYPIEDFYLTNPIARSSPTHAALLGRAAPRRDFAEAAE